MSHEKRIEQKKEEMKIPEPEIIEKEETLEYVSGGW
jgi:hypothetical protein